MKAVFDRAGVRASLAWLAILVLVAAFADLVGPVPGGNGGGGGVLRELVHATQAVVGLTGSVLVVALGFGLLLGVVAGAGPRIADFLLTRCVEFSGLWPTVVLFALVRAAEPAPSAQSFVAVVGAVQAVRIARLVRGEVLCLQGRPFVIAAGALGASPARVLVRHILPHAAGPVLVSSAFMAAAVVSLDAALGLVGLMPAAEMASWGTLLAKASAGAPPGAWLPAASCVVLTTGALYRVATALDESLDPRRVRAAQARIAHRRAARPAENQR